ncbi:MAG: thiosulfate oxidation carrier protein SoxY [Herminiimonas sp.]|nr:thiosulfate oxidation carrier protein SoxY [Herminiimonas sp.]
MNQQRRDALRISTVLGLAVAAGLMTPFEAFAAETWNSAAFDTKTLNDTVKALGGSSATVSKDLILSAPDIAENGAVVPISVTTTLPGVQQIAILVEKNPNALSANFTIPAGTEAYVSTRVKMAQTSNVFALAKVDGKWLVASKEVKVTLGGCGG